MRLSYIAAALASAITLCEGSSKMVIGYLPNWLNNAEYPIESIPFNKYTHINYAFAILNNENNLPSFPDNEAVEASLPRIVDMAHANNTKVLLSVGGWTGSKRFSPMVATAESRKKFINWSMDFVEKYDIDGIDLDWEYPGKQAAGCNEFADNDADNFLLLLKELREALDTEYPDVYKEISMAVHVQPFVKYGVPMTDVKEYVPYFDHINLMTYDMNGAWAPTTAPNAPFLAEEGKGAPFSFVTSINDWKAAGVPSDKITAGLAFYGRAMKAQVDMTTERSQFQSSEIGAPKGDSDDAIWEDPYCKVDTGGFSGIWKWSNLRKEGVLQDDFVTPGEGWQRNWDDVTQTPWLFNPSTKHFITYDDPQSLKVKVEHALCEDLAGVMVWDIHQDNGELIEVVNSIHNTVPTSCINGDISLKDNTAPGKGLSDIQEKEKITSELDANIDEIESKDFENDDDWKDEDSYWLNDDSTTTTATTFTGSSLASIDTSETSVSSTESHLSIPTEPSSDVDNYDDTPCSNNGERKCVSAGKSSTWLTCNFSKWLASDCIAGLVCNESGGAVFCDYPSNSEAAAVVPEPMSNQQESENKLFMAVQDPLMAAEVINEDVAVEISVSAKEAESVNEDAALEITVYEEAPVSASYEREANGDNIQEEAIVISFPGFSFSLPDIHLPPFFFPTPSISVPSIFFEPPKSSSFTSSISTSSPSPQPTPSSSSQPISSSASSSISQSSNHVSSSSHSSAKVNVTPASSRKRASRPSNSVSSEHKPPFAF